MGAGRTPPIGALVEAGQRLVHLVQDGLDSIDRGLRCQCPGLTGRTARYLRGHGLRRLSFRCLSLGIRIAEDSIHWLDLGFTFLGYCLRYLDGRPGPVVDRLECFDHGFQCINFTFWWKTLPVRFRAGCRPAFNVWAVRGLARIRPTFHEVDRTHPTDACP